MNPTPKADRFPLAATLRVSRLNAGISLRSAAEQAGISPPFLSDLELGRRNATADVLARIAAAIGVDPSIILNAGIKQRLVDLETTRDELLQRLAS